MKFDELDERMRVFETAHDVSVLPGLFIVVRIDGRGFTRLTKDILKMEAPFDVRFRDAMRDTVAHVMDCGLRTVFGYTQSDEISILLHRDDDSFNRKERKLVSVLAGEASAKLSRLLNEHAAFDGRVSQLPSVASVVDYFRWRQEDAGRNALNGHCYWKLRAEGESPGKAQRRLNGMSRADKNELLFQRGVNFNDLPAWQKRGIGFVWETYTKEGVNPKTGETSLAERARLRVIEELPMGDDYAALIGSLPMA